MRPLSRESSAASTAGLAAVLAAATSTRSAPRSLVQLAMRGWRVGRRHGEIGAQRSASSQRAGIEIDSRPTRQPCARRICTASRPIAPSPITTARSPSCGSASRTPCSAMAPSVVNAASSNADRLAVARMRDRHDEVLRDEVRLRRAWRSRRRRRPRDRRPSRRSRRPRPRRPCRRRRSLAPLACRAATSPLRTPARFHRAAPSEITCLTRSGRLRALSSSEPLANSIAARSVPAEISDAAVRTSTPGPEAGAEARREPPTVPCRIDWTSCFTGVTRRRVLGRR